MSIGNVKTGSVAQNVSLWTLQHSATHQKPPIPFTTTNHQEHLPVRQISHRVKRTPVHAMSNLSTLLLVRYLNTIHTTQIHMAGILIHLANRIWMQKDPLTNAVGHFQLVSRSQLRVDHVVVVVIKLTMSVPLNAVIICWQQLAHVQGHKSHRHLALVSMEVCARHRG